MHFSFAWPVADQKFYRVVPGSHPATLIMSEYLTLSSVEFRSFMLGGRPLLLLLRER